MNERIRELGRQATIWCIDQPNQEDFDAMWEEKFAELIVRECSHIAKVNQLQSMNWDIGEILLEHFGVE